MKLFYTESGNKQGPLFVFLHGGGVTSWMWDEQLTYFKDYHCVTVDLPGHGKSVHIQSFMIEDIAEEVLMIIESLRDDKEVILCGFSIGRSEEHTSELQSRGHLVCRLLLEKKKQRNK